MSDFAAMVLTAFFSRIDLFMIITVRVLAFIIVLPALSSSSIPNIAKVTLAVSISFILFTSDQVALVPYGETVPGFVFLLINEFFIGFTLAFVVYMVFSVIYLTGQLIDFQIGFSMLSVMDPISQIQVPIMGNLLYFTMAVLMVQSGALHVFITALFLSFEKIPIGTGVLLGHESVYMYIVEMMGVYLELGMRIAMPIVGSIIIVDVALGILVKSVPQMNVFVVGMPFKLLVGLVVMYITLPSIAGMIDVFFNEADKALAFIIGGLSP